MSNLTERRRRAVVPERTGSSHSSTLPADIDDLWARVLQEYKEAVGVDIFDTTDAIIPELASCKSGDDILAAIEATTKCLADKRAGSRVSQKLRAVLKPLVHGLSLVLDATAETASSLRVPGGKGIFTAIVILLKAAEGVSAAFDDIERLFERFRAYVERLQVRLKAPLGREARTIAIKGIVEMLKALSMATIMMRRHRFGLFSKALTTKGDGFAHINRALADIVSDEEKMVVTDVLVGMHDLSSEVLHVRSSISDLSETTTAATRMVLSETREHERQRKMDVDALKDMLQTLLERNTEPLQLSADEESKSVLPATAITVFSRQRVNCGRFSSWPIRRWATRLLRVFHRFKPEDQDIIWRAFATLCSWAIDSTDVGLSQNVTFELTTDSALSLVGAIEAILPTACTFLLLFLIWKVCSVSRPLGWSGGSVIVVDALGEVLELHQDTFFSWESTHDFIVQAFHGRPGSPHVIRRSYGLSNSDYLLIGREEWPQLVKPGAKLKMSIIVGSYTSRCPFCERETTGHEEPLPNGRIICARVHCGRPYASYQNKDSSTTVEPESFEETSQNMLVSRIHHLPRYTIPYATPRDGYPEHTNIFQRVIVEYRISPPLGRPQGSARSRAD